MPSILDSLVAQGDHTGVLFPPLNFSMILPGVYRSGHPHKTNFPFLDSLNLRSIMYLSPEDYRHDTHSWAQERGLDIFHVRVDVSKDPTVEVDEALVREALEKVLDERNLPILLHDNKGRHLPSILAALLRFVTDWTLEAALDEYRVFLPPEDDWVREKPGKSKKEKERAADLQLIARFPLDSLTYDPQHAPPWLKRTAL
ncbi:tyrosine phosphatase family-domain-containing protein [Rhodotorula diobovata]|uniref:Tyrosine phosphatase family-domain-containing protein n=1 Tax=Rhodotorula diobovata TaxID=5288 RepID=A0A5C5FSX9_9BASI|nr:tyrosine phosphatase family-domain-containing protein [Rhodotorula diobovata]